MSEEESIDDDASARRWATVKAALAEALGLAAPARAQWLAGLQARDASLADEVAELLALQDQGGDRLESLSAGLLEEVVQTRLEQRHIGQRLGAYRIVSRLGSGGMGDVYLGERADGAYEMQVAIKLLRDGLPADADISRFERERQILASLEHVNLAKVLDGGVTDGGMPYFVMERVDGLPLNEYCERIGATLTQRLELLRTVCQVVHYVNQRGVIHRDLKPRNILVTPTGVVKLLDFGIATRLDDAAGATTAERTRTALRSMTLLYSSPEQVRGDAVGAASDVYALGVVMFNLLTGDQPYRLDPAVASSFELARAICDGEPRRMSEAVAAGPARLALRNGLRGDLDAIVAKALRKDAAARYASAQQLADDLFRHQSMLPVQARQGAWSYRLGRWLLKHRAFAGAAIVANLALLAGIGVALHQAHEARLQRERAERNFASVRALANVFMFDFHDAIASLPGSIAARRLVVDRAMTYLQALAKDAAPDPALTLELAVSHRKIGDIQGRPNSPNLGDVTGALANYDRAAALLQPLLDSPSAADRGPAQLEFALARGRKGSTLSFQGRFADAEQSLREATTQLEALLRTDPGNLSAQQQRASAYGLLSWVRHEQGDLAGFEANAAKSEQMLRAFVADHPDHEGATFDLAAAYARRGVSYLDRDRTAASARLALEPLQGWARLMITLLARTPGDPRLSDALAEAENYLGLAWQRVGEPERAREAIARCIALLAKEAALDPADDDLHFRLMNAHVSMASIRLDQHDAPVAREHALLAIADFEGRPEAARRVVMNRHSLAQAHFLLGRAWAEIAHQGAGAAARTAQQSACREFRRSQALLQALPEIPQSSNNELGLADTAQALAACAP